MDVPRVGTAGMPAIGLGTSGLEGRACTRIVRRALEVGYRHVDTAQLYGNEAAIGDAIEGASVDREDVFLTTKVWRSNLRYDDVIESTEESLDRLGVDAVDLLLVHWPHPRVPIGETMRALETLQTEGKTRHVGVSNFTRAQLEEAIDVADVPVVANQVHYNPYADQSGLQSLCAQRGIALTAYSPLAKGRAADDDTLAAIGRGYDKSAAQVALRWLVQQECVVAIPRTGNPDHLEANLDVFDFELTDAEMSRIDDLAGGVRATFRNVLPSLVRSFPL